ncbi:phosphoglucosamine mutase [Halorubrum sp. DTA98]|uniref:phosphoglucosamine mutase n=1 Tax=Halorubrum sp. DTA98 TaxID=3402163 RepID=UPI003AAE8FDF
MFGTSGVRGRVGVDVTAETALAIGRAVGTDGASRIVVGRDTRESGRMLLDAVAAGAAECGATVIDLGVVSTPTVARSVGWERADAGIVVTASHNPPADNGIKLWTPGGQAFDDRRRTDVERAIDAGAYALADWEEVGGRRDGRDRALRRHRDRLLAAIDVAQDNESSTDGASEPPAVVVDIGNGTGRITADVLHDAGCSVETLNAQPDGRFPGRESEPTAESCSSLRSLVATGADVGIAHDGDADRTLAVDDRGRFVPGDALLALFGREAARAGDVVVAPVNTSLAVDEALAEVGAELVRTRVGDVHVAERATAENAVFGGEPSGAWIWPAETLCPDGPFAACKLVDLVANRGPLSTLVDDLPAYPIRRDAVRVDAGTAGSATAGGSRSATRIVSEVAGRLSDRYGEVSTLDGVRAETDDGWILVRASGTQPLIRLTAEGRTDANADRLLETARELVGEAL